MMSKNIDLIKYPVITSKATRLLDKNQYTFLVDPHMTKTSMKKTVEILFNVKVCKINSFNLAQKKRRVGQFSGIRPKYKKVIITLTKGDTIKLFSNY